MAKVPAHVAQGRRPPFPAGVFVGDLGDVKDSWNNEKTALACLINFSNIAPFDEESPQVGGRQKTQRVNVIAYDAKNAKSTALVDVTEFDDSVPYSLQQSATLLTQLALALGAPTGSDSEGNIDMDFDAFLGDLLAGVYKGRSVVFEVRHRTYARKDDAPGKKTGIGDDIAGFRTVDEGEAAEATVEAPVAAPAPRLSGVRSRK